jgi:hypothetical protein
MLLPHRLSLTCCFAGADQTALWQSLCCRRLSMLLKTLQK